MRQDYRIIVEGPDGGGKTNLIEWLQGRFHNFEVIRNELGPEQDFDTWWPEQLDREKSQIIPVHDRFFYSELIYGPLIRGHLKPPEVLVNNVLWFLRSHSLLIYCRPHSETLEAGRKQLPQMEGVELHYENLLEGYDILMAQKLGWYKDRFIRHDWVNPQSLKDVEKLVERYMLGELE